MYLLIWIVSGIIAGWLTGLVMKGEGYGVIGDFVLGLLGGVLGGWLAREFHLRILPGTWIGHLVVAVAGGVVLVALVRMLRRL